jgi:hypothetical protein
MGSPNGGIIGVINPSSFGKCTQTIATASSTLSLQPGTRTVQSVIVGGGGGGGGQSATGGTGGPGGGGKGSDSTSADNAVAGTVNTGGGGGGGGGGAGPCTGQRGAAGGSGIVIVRAPGTASISASPGTNTVATLPAPAGGCKVATFTVSGDITIG